jgi:mono/diheme cytochrome c family protein
MVGTNLVITFPMQITSQVLDRGRERYDIYCSPCHGATGDGKGIVVRRGFPAPPSYHIPRLRNAPAGHFFDVMTRGYGVMYSYASRVTPEDRWAITAYIRALQLSQDATLSDVPANEIARLKNSP